MASSCWCSTFRRMPHKHQPGLCRSPVTPPDPWRYDALAALAMEVVDAWMVDAERLDEKMDMLRDFLKDKPEALARGCRVAQTVWA